MRSQIFRSEKGVAATATAVFVATLDGQRSVSLFAENMDQKAALIMRTGGNSTGNSTPATRSAAYRTHNGKNGCLKFEAAVAGAAGDQVAAQVWSVDDTPADTAFVDETADFASAGANDVAVFPATEAIGDYFAVGSVQKFGTLRINTGTGGTVGTVAWEYWNGTVWTALSGVTDGTTGFTVTGFQNVTFTVPADWAKRVINGSASLYYVRARVTTVYTVNPLVTQGFIGSVGGNSNTIEITCGVVNQAFSIQDPGANAWRINLRCNSDGTPNQTVSEVMKAIAADTSAAGVAFRSAINVSLPVWSDGSSPMVALDSDATHVIPAATALAGGTVATTTAAGATVETSPVGPEGPWVVDTAAGTALSSVANNTAKTATLVDKPAKAVRISLVAAGTGTWLGVTIVVDPLT